MNCRQALATGQDIIIQVQTLHIRLPFQVIVNTEKNETEHIPKVITVREKNKRLGQLEFKTAEWFVFYFQERKKHPENEKINFGRMRRMELNLSPIFPLSSIVFIFLSKCRETTFHLVMSQQCKEKKFSLSFFQKNTKFR